MNDRIDKERKYWDAFAGKYDQFITKNAGNGYHLLFKMFAEDTARSQKLLEMATGTGLIALEMSRHIPEITATDLSQEMLKIAKEKAEKQHVENVTFQMEDICSLSFPDHSFDSVIASNVLHLLFEPDRAMQEIRRVVTPGGKVIVPTYCHGESLLSHCVSRLMGLSGFKARSRWSVGSFHRFVEKNGFEVVKHQIVKGVIPMLYLVAKPVVKS